MEENEKLLATIKEEVKGTIEESTKGFAKESDVENLKTLVENATTKEQIETVKSTIDELSLSVKAIQEQPKGAEKLGSIEAYLEKNKESIEAFANKTVATFKTDIALKDFSIGGSFTDDPSGIPFLPVDFRQEIARTPDTREQFNILNYVNVGTTNSEVISWMEEESETGAALFIDECVAKPDVSKTWLRNSTTARKVADFSKVCDEVLWFLPRMRQEIEGFLRKLVYIAIQEAILSGDGTGFNLLGIIPQSTAFVAGTKAASVSMANYSDAIRAAASQINCLGYRANVALVNCDDLFIFESTKDANGQYLIGGLGGVQLVECPFITPGDFLIGDFSKSNVDFFRGISSEWDRNGDDFKENAISVRSEAYLAHYIASNHVNAFIYDSFANVITLIDKP